MDDPVGEALVIAVFGAFLVYGFWTGKMPGFSGIGNPFITRKEENPGLFSMVATLNFIVVLLGAILLIRSLLAQ